MVVVATVRALKHHGGCPKAELGVPSLEYLERRQRRTWRRHVENMQSKFGLPVCVAINAFPTDSRRGARSTCGTLCARLGVPCALSEVFAKGGAGGLELAEDVLGILEKRPVRFTYPDDAHVADKVRGRMQKHIRRGGRGVFRRPQKSSLRSWTPAALAACPCASPRRSTASRTTPRCWPRPPASR